MTKIITKKSSKAPILKIKFISHGTLESKDLQVTRRFYEEVLGLEVIQNTPMSMLVRRGGHHTYAVVQTGRDEDMPLLNHNGLDVDSEDSVREAHQLLQSVQTEYGIRKIMAPHELHGVYSFYFQDLDGNWWEILANPLGGYSQMFDKPELDLTDHSDCDR